MNTVPKEFADGVRRGYHGEVPKSEHPVLIPLAQFVGSSLKLITMAAIGCAIALALFGCSDSPNEPQQIAPPPPVSVSGQWIVYNDFQEDTLFLAMDGESTNFTGTLHGGDVFPGTLPITGYVYEDSLFYFGTEVDKPGIGCYVDFPKRYDGEFHGMLRIHQNFGYTIYWNYVHIKRQ